MRRYLKKDLKLGKKKFKHLVVIGHPDKKSFCYNGIFKTITKELEDNNALLSSSSFVMVLNIPL